MGYAKSLTTTACIVALVPCHYYAYYVMQLPFTLIFPFVGINFIWALWHSAESRTTVVSMRLLEGHKFLEVQTMNMFGMKTKVRRAQNLIFFFCFSNEFLRWRFQGRGFHI